MCVRLYVCLFSMSSSLQPIHGTADSDQSSTETISARYDRIQNDTSQLFLFSPDDELQHGKLKRQVQKFELVCGESVDVEVYVSNPFQFELVIQRMELLTSGVPFQAFPQSTSLTPNTQMQKVVLSGKALQDGKLNITGCAIR